MTARATHREGEDGDDQRGAEGDEQGDDGEHDEDDVEELLELPQQLCPVAGEQRAEDLVERPHHDVGHGEDEVDDRRDGVADALPEAGILEIAEVDVVEGVDGAAVERVLLVADLVPLGTDAVEDGVLLVDLVAHAAELVLRPGQLVAELIGGGCCAARGVGEGGLLGVADVVLQLGHLRGQPPGPLVEVLALVPRGARPGQGAVGALLRPTPSAGRARGGGSSKMSAARPAIRGTSSSSSPTWSTKRAKAFAASPSSALFASPWSRKRSNSRAISVASCSSRRKKRRASRNSCALAPCRFAVDVGEDLSST